MNQPSLLGRSVSVTGLCFVLFAIRIRPVCSLLPRSGHLYLYTHYLTQNGNDSTTAWEGVIR